MASTGSSSITVGDLALVDESEPSSRVLDVGSEARVRFVHGNARRCPVGIGVVKTGGTSPALD
jgi:hypothetical protein